jgi:RluA family pseudouridine synthase
MHAGGRFHRNTLKHVLDGLYHPQQPRPAHRLDANTTGVLVVARTAYIAGKLQPQFARGEVQKIYLARVPGHPPGDEFECAAPISATAGEMGSRSVDAQGGRAALTRFKVLRRDSASTLLEARPLTGRTNQIRVHLSHLGWPVLGDPAYLSGGALGDSQTLPLSAPPLCLHAWHISFQHPVQRKSMTFTAPEPAWARQVS